MTGRAAIRKDPLPAATPRSARATTPRNGRESAVAAPPVFRVGDWPMAHFARMERRHEQNANRVLAPSGLVHREWRVLALLSEHETLAIHRIAELSATERSTISKMLDRLEAKQLLARASSETDARATPVMLTAAGRALLASTIPRIRALFDAYREGMSDTELATLMRLLERMGRQVESVDATR